MKTTIAIFRLDDYSDYDYYVEEKEIGKATFGDLEECGWDSDDMGLECVGENEDGEQLYISSFDFDGELTWEELRDVETDWYAVSYWDGNNWQIDVFENYYTEEMVIERDYESEKSPLYYYCYVITLENGHQMRATQSNCSGSLSPYYEIEK